MNRSKEIFTRLVLLMLMALSTPCVLLANKPVQRNKSMEHYIQAHYQEALRQMQLYKIPASIKIAQALIETGAGKSNLAQVHNNHFGIKCHRSWVGGKTYQGDDAPNECFRSYSRWQDSYEDHSNFLQASRYKQLFTLSLNDYQGWAKGLQRAGYATHKGYANGLIRLVETYELYMFDQGQLPSWMNASEDQVIHASFDRKDKKTTHQLRPSYISYDLLYVLAEDGETYEDIAQEFGISAKKLARYNDAPITFPLRRGDVVYLEKKPKRTRAKQTTHIVEIGDSMHSIAQKYGIRVASLYKLNYKDEDYVPSEGDILLLR